MNFVSGSDLLDGGTAGDGGTGEALRVLLVDEAKLSDEGLRSRLGALGRAESALAAMKSRALAELSRRHSTGDAQRLVRDELQASKREAKRDVESAARLAELPATSEALASGEIPVGHARLIARASGESSIDEALLVEAANTEPFDEFARTVKRHQQEVADDDGQALLDRQRRKRKARIFESAESGMFVLSGEFDQITGARIATALTAKERQLWHREDPNKRATPQQRMADALAELICEPASGRSAGTDLLVIADFDVIKQQLDNPRLADGSPIPIVELHRLALEANLLPSIFDTKAQDMWLGRRLRTATEAQRIALIARDQHCIGCGANPLWCRAHHIIWWSKEGPTDLENLALVCDDCHHKIHDHGWQVYKHPKTGKFKLKPPTNPPAEAERPPTRAEETRPTSRDAARDGAMSNQTRADETRPTSRDAARDGAMGNQTRADETRPTSRDAARDGAMGNQTRADETRPTSRDAARDGAMGNQTRADETRPTSRDAARDGAMGNQTRADETRPTSRDAARDGAMGNQTRADETRPTSRDAARDGAMGNQTRADETRPTSRDAAHDGATVNQTRADETRPISGDAARITERDEVRWGNQSNPDAIRQRRTARRSTGQDSVDYIDDS